MMWSEIYSRKVEKNMSDIYDLAILGGGPAGITAAI